MLKQNDFLILIVLFLVGVFVSLFIRIISHSEIKESKLLFVKRVLFAQLFVPLTIPFVFPFFRKRIMKLVSNDNRIKKKDKVLILNIISDNKECFRFILFIYKDLFINFDDRLERNILKLSNTDIQKRKEQSKPQFQLNIFKRIFTFYGSAVTQISNNLLAILKSQALPKINDGIYKTKSHF
ncbi:hypothetical protein [Lysinibacillus xylanilyticus]|uniref:hypothetical protein n=1 Tax=Lysinibacillus xylanilyticus TaxID=582475 RepID=UPI003D094912